MKKFRPDLQAQIYAMVAWNGKTMEEAEALVQETIDRFNGDENKAFEEIDKNVWATSSIVTAMQGIEEHMDELQGEGKYDAIIEILTGIHDKWVSENTKKYDRGNPEKSQKQIFQHLPTELIGVDEVAKDLMFLAPFLSFEVGQMQTGAYGSFVPSQEIVDAYNRAAKKFLEEHKIVAEEDLRKALPSIIDEYKPLHGEHELTQARLDYMNASLDRLTQTVVAKQSPEMFDEPENE